uniref:SHSP domain-containing protein n=1 Tax=Parastrongyloides trichosuri TaxID=131310 RepID=A0A0N4Z275_PARTI
MNRYSSSRSSSYSSQSKGSFSSSSIRGSGIAKCSETYHSPYANYDCTFVRGIVPSKRNSYICDWPYNQKSDGYVVASSHGGNIELSFDVRQFKPREIKINVDGERLNIFCKHEKGRESNICGKNISKTYHLPSYINPSTLTHEITKDGDLIIRAAKTYKLNHVPYNNT